MSNKNARTPQHASPVRTKQHDRAISELTASTNQSTSRGSMKGTSRMDANDEPWDASHGPPAVKKPLNVQTTSLPSRTRNSQPQTPISPGGRASSSSTSPVRRVEPPPPATPESFSVATTWRPGTANTADSQAHNTFLNMDDESQDSTSSDSASSGPESSKPKLIENLKIESGISLDGLIDRLLALPMSKHDEKFAPIFLCLYRKFTSPIALLSNIMARFDVVDKSSAPRLTKAAEQLRYLQVLAKWTGEYPGDFSMEGVRKKALAFVRRLERSQVFFHAAREIGNHLETSVEDEYRDWIEYDMFEGHGEIDSSSGKPVDARASMKASSLERSHISTESSLEDLHTPSPRNSGAPSQASSNGRTANTSNQSLPTETKSLDVQKEAQSLAPIPRTRLTKIQWHQFIDTPDEEFARELTRIDWILYSAIQPRDLVRMVSVANSEKHHSKSLQNVGRYTDHFNHLSLFVMNMILLRDKPKHRAIALTKFMCIAWKVRRHNNYNTLGSLISAIKGVPIQRLALTAASVPEATAKEFGRLELLMGATRSHAKYRLAWENSFAERIPYLPLVRRDLAAAENGNRTFLGPEGDKINWKKFEIMGETIISIQKSQERPYNFVRNEELTKLVLENKVCNEVILVTNHRKIELTNGIGA